MKRNSLCKKALTAMAVLSAVMLLSVPSKSLSAAEQADNAVLVESSLKAANSFNNLQCGENVYGTLAGGTLTISGTGDMWDGSSNYSSNVFYLYRDSIREVVIKDGVTNVSRYIFYGFSKLEKVTLADSVEIIGCNAFSYTGIRRFVCPQNLKSIEDNAFYRCSSLQTVTFNEGLESIGYHAMTFANIKEAIIPEGCLVHSMAFNNTILHYKTTVTLNADGGTVDGMPAITLVQYEKEAYGRPTKLPTPVREGYDFLGWYDYTDGIEGNNVAESTEKVKYHAVLRAKWCNHSSTVLKYVASATYTKEGYTGDTYCANKSCGKRLKLGHSISCKTLAAPKMSSVENVKGGLKITWIKSKDAKGYDVYRKKDGVYRKIARVKNATSYVDGSVKNFTGKSYVYKVCAYHGSATSKFSATKSQVRVANANISSLKSTSRKTMMVKWKKVSGCTGYQIEYSKDSKFRNNVTKKQIKHSSDTSKKISKLSSKKKYYVRIRSYKVVNGKKYYSGWSKVENVKVK